LNFNMNLFEKIRKKLFAQDPKSNRKESFDNGTAINNDTSAEQKFRSIYGDEKYELQKLYEKWAVKELWLLRDQALPLLLGIEPGSPRLKEDVEIREKIEDMWNHAKKCVEQGVLDINSVNGDDTKWGIRPLDAYRWATIGRIPLPAELCALMDFIASTIRRMNMSETTISGKSDNKLDSNRFDQAREQVLGMALAILAAWPDKCRNSRGRIKSDKLVRIIEQKSSFWLGDKELDVSPVVMRDILDKWLGTLPEQVD